MNGQIYPCCSGATNVWKYQYNAKKTIHDGAKRRSQKMNEVGGFVWVNLSFQLFVLFLIFPFSQLERSLTTKLKVSNTRAVIIPPKETCPQKTSRHYQPKKLILWREKNTFITLPAKKKRCWHEDSVESSENWLIVHESKSCAVSAVLYWQQ